MSVLARSIILSVILAAAAVPALAASEERGQPNNLVAWMFLGFCALIIVAQVAPLIWNAIRHTKGAEKQVKTSEQHH
jgi:hypothetical protein